MLSRTLLVAPDFHSNGEAERAVRTIKNLLKKSADPYMAMLIYRTTPMLLVTAPQNS